MSKIFFFSILSILIASCSSNEKMSDQKMDLVYPETKKDATVVDSYHGTEITDPYRWLEIDTAENVKQWVKEQNKVTFDYLEKIPYRQQIEDRYEELFNYVKLSSPSKAGDYYFFYKNDGLQNQAVLYCQKGLEGEPEVFIDPNKLSAEGTASINILGFSKDNKYVAYSRQDAGSDWQKIYVMEIESKKQLPDVLEWVKFSGAEWKGDGFYYSRYPAPTEGTEYSAANAGHSVYYHKLGTDQSKDKLVYSNPDEPKMYHFTSITEDRKYLVLYASTGTDGYETHYMDLSREDEGFKPLFTGFKNKSSVVHNLDDHFLVMTDIDAPKYRLVNIDLNKPGKENWVEVIPESENLLESVSPGGGKLWASYLRKARTRVYRFNYDGSKKKRVELPGVGTANGFGGREDDDHFFYSYTSFIVPNTIYKFDVASLESEPFFESELKYNPDDYVEKQVSYTSKDGTKIPMFIVHRKDLQLNGKNPTYLYGYGGFNVNLSPYFSTSRLILLENGGVFALPNLRGGGEFGEEWHQAGMLHNKQNVFDDFIAAAEYLIKMNYTSKDKLAIAGGSNGGLLVGACMTQRPDLFAAAFPAVGVMDMLRYHKFTVGWGWIPEYGSADDEEHFENLLSYSPLHNLEEGVSYPATMITTADHDDRVVPAHSFKFGARLQECHEGDNPVILRIETDAGHGAGKPTSKIIEEEADRWSFFFYNTNSPVKYIEG
ncbi:MAG: prolyl oligopeptidase family serine peptidase [Bacteroidia bacterium]|nr:prolyl oligopeptidase family serine peptidase [Bacteroidia bacterium]